jgi:hypothetical protein
MGGMGNQLFQVAFADLLSNHVQVALRVDPISSVRHSVQPYLSTLMKQWRHLQTTNVPRYVFEEVNLRPQNWLSIVSSYPDAFLVGYFQNFQYVTPEFISKLQLPTHVLQEFPHVRDTIFLHIRGSDYVDHPIHDVKLDYYYQRAIDLFPVDTKFSIFTNDKKYASSRPFLKGIDYTFIESEDEVDALYLMTQCKGGICANSTFSWWGAYLNTNRKLILPSKWFNDPSYYTDGLYFNGCTIVEV